MAVGDAHVFPGFLTAVLTQISFQSHQLLFSHASAEVRVENMPGKKFRLNWVSNSQPPGHESNTPLSHPGGADKIKIFSFGKMLVGSIPIFHQFSASFKPIPSLCYGTIPILVESYQMLPLTEYIYKICYKEIFA